MMNSEGHKDRTLIITLLGVLILLVGIVAAVLGPVEMYCFYLFSEGGRFHYEGFGFGSFMFANLAAQIAGYYLIAAVFIPLGYGHLKARRWARTLSLVLLRFWLIAGIPLTFVFAFFLFSAKDISLAPALVILILLGLSYLILPGLLIRFYQSRHVRLTFESRDPGSYWIERVPVPILTLCVLFLLYVFMLHVPILLNGMFPFFGVMLSDIGGIIMLDVAIWSLVLLTWGVVRRKRWAWWGSLAYFSLLSLSTILTFLMTDFGDILARLDLPPTEMTAFQGMPLHGYHFAAFLGIPLLVTLGLIVSSKRYFGSYDRTPKAESS
jgi:hypothetical protein